MRPVALTLTLLMLFAGVASATTFVVPDDGELIAKSAAIAIGTVEGSYVQETDGIIETVYEIRLEQSLKGIPRRSELLSIVSPGGVLGDRALHVEAAAHFNQGDHVLLFLTRHKGRWTTTDLTLGKFRFVTSTTGAELLVRDMEDVVGWDHRGRVHHEQVRRREGFLRFIRERLNGRAPLADYLIDASEVTLAPEQPLERRRTPTVDAPFPGATYTSWVSSQPTRWPNISAGVTFRKVANQNISGVADGGVAVIQGGLAAWTNECGSVINLIYGGTTNTPSTSFDGVNVVEFNDPQSRISGSWTGSGTIGICFNSFSSSHSFAGRTWWSISDADVVFQNGYPGTAASFRAAMTHELGHGLGWRHSNQNHMTQGAACNPSVEECTSAAIMNSSVNSSYAHTLQPWDVNAAQSVYPGGTCGPAPGTATRLRTDFDGDGMSDIFWRNTLNGLTAIWFMNGVSTRSAVNLPTVPVANTPVALGDLNGDGRSDVFWRNNSTGANTVWLMNGSAVTEQAAPSASPGWNVVASGDFNGDGRLDLFWRNQSNGQNQIWYMTGASATVVPQSTVASDWQVAGAGDFDGNGRFDVLWRNSNYAATVLWLMTAGGTQGVTIQARDNSWSLSTTGDFNRDGRYDVFWRQSGTGANSVWLMNGTTYIEVLFPTVGAGWNIGVVGDFDEDGTHDVAWHNTNGGNHIWLITNAQARGFAIPGTGSGWEMFGAK
jgi:hypothetical protein